MIQKREKKKKIEIGKENKKSYKHVSIGHIIYNKTTQVAKTKQISVFSFASFCLLVVLLLLLEVGEYFLLECLISIEHRNFYCCKVSSSSTTTLLLLLFVALETTNTTGLSNTGVVTPFSHMMRVSLLGSHPASPNGFCDPI